ncbi:NAD(P)/FAD-dependent oxidoreductase [Lachnospiraceae bacterium LCP25S3_G4]
MIRIGQVKLPPDHTKQELLHKLLKTLRIQSNQLITYEIRKQSIDARKKNQIKFVYTIDVTVEQEQRVLKHIKDNNVCLISEKAYDFSPHGTEELPTRPVVIGSGPAGLFCTYFLAKQGYRPILLERGACVEERVKDVEAFWNSGQLNSTSNVQFGEGGAGTFSDGKLNTLVKDPDGRGRVVLETFVEHGASKEILYVNKPHIGTDMLVDVIKNMRDTIHALGGEIRFHEQVTDIRCVDSKITELEINKTKLLKSNIVVLAIGHSARDTFQMLYQHHLAMEPKAFAIGLRIEHPQDMINKSQYGTTALGTLPTASYKLTTQLENGRGVYSFCMCPGGYVVNASSEPKRLAINGMSYHARKGVNANSAIVVTVTPEDYGVQNALSGIAYQRKLEEQAFLIGNGKIPIQKFGDYCNNQCSTSMGDVIPQMKGDYIMANLRQLFSDEISHSIEEGIKKFDQKIPGFSREDAILSGVESRTSSPVRILRNEGMQSNVEGIYPCGEGAGYAGGIMSAAMDGIKVAEAICQKYKPHVI